MIVATAPSHRTDQPANARRWSVLQRLSICAGCRFEPNAKTILERVRVRFSELLGEARAEVGFPRAGDTGRAAKW